MMQIGQEQDCLPEESREEKEKREVCPRETAPRAFLTPFQPWGLIRAH